MKKRRAAGLAAVIVIALQLLSGCGGYTFYGRVEGYGERLRNLKIYRDYPPAPKIAGLTPLVDFGFGYAAAFNGEYAYAAVEGDRYIVGRDGGAVFCENLGGYELIDDKYIFREGGLYGVKTIFGRTLIEPRYTKIRIGGGAVLCESADGTKTTYYDGVLVRENFYGDVKLSDGGLLYNDKAEYFSLGFERLFCGGYAVASDITEGIMFITDGNFYGYGTPNGGVVVSPRYSFLTPFANGYAVAGGQSGTAVLDRSGAEVFAFNEIGFTPLSFDGKYLVFRRGGFIGVADAGGAEIDGISLSTFMYNRVFSDYIITEDGTRFFSVSGRDYVPGAYDKITPCGGRFAVLTPGGTYSLLDGNLNPLIENCGQIEYSRGVFMMQIDAKYYYYV